MKSGIKRIMQLLLANDFSWALASPFVYVAKRISRARDNYMDKRSENYALCENIFSKKQVLNGMFKGLLYADIRATGSRTYAKLLGSYEMELLPALERLTAVPYNNLINIGSDEGYYAVGLARLVPELNVIAFDCNKTAREKCTALALLNGVQDRIKVKGCFSMNDLEAHDKQGRCLVIIDCEGCENEIIDDRLVKEFAKADFIIELHYEQNPQVLSKMENLFAATHRISLIRALCDHERVMNYTFPELENLTSDQKKYIVTERDNYMHWLVAEAV